MKKYLSFFIIRLTTGLQYRAAALAGISTQFAWGGMTLLMFRAFYQYSSSAFPMTFRELSSYIWLQQAFLALYMSWYFDNDIFDSITSGSIAYELCRPVDLYTMWFAKNAAVRMSRAVLRCMPILVIAAFLPEPFNVSLPASFLSGLLFLISMIMGFLVLVAFSMLIYITALYTLSPLGIRVVATSAIEFFTGAIIPLPFFPQSIRNIVHLLPFAYIQNTPFLIYNGYISGTEMYKSILLQAVWLLLLWASGKLLMKRALKKVIVQGG
ncbi:MAG TPA: ABC transporter permease [Clostridiales bacterium]|nr:ABC transporter permease [Clostridiales bacterium]